MAVQTKITEVVRVAMGQVSLEDLEALEESEAYTFICGVVA